MKINAQRYSQALKEIEEGTVSLVTIELLKIILSDRTLDTEYVRQLSPPQLKDKLEDAVITYNGPDRRLFRTDFKDSTAVLVMDYKSRYGKNGWATVSLHYYW